MSCPTCRHTMHNMGMDQSSRRVFLCPRCGTYKSVDPPPADGSEPYTVVEAPRWTRFLMAGGKSMAGLDAEVSAAREAEGKVKALIDAAADAEAEAAKAGIRKLAISGPRVETGPVQFDHVVPPGQDWPGVFIRGDNAAYYAMSLLMILRGNGAAPQGVTIDGITLSIIKGLAILLDGCNVNPKARIFDEGGNVRQAEKASPMPQWMGHKIVSWGMGGRVKEWRFLSDQEKAAAISLIPKLSENIPITVNGNKIEYDRQVIQFERLVEFIPRLVRPANPPTITYIGNGYFGELYPGEFILLARGIQITMTPKG